MGTCSVAIVIQTFLGDNFYRIVGLNVIVFMGGIDMIFPFSRNVPANYKFSLFSKLPANYPKISEKNTKNIRENTAKRYSSVCKLYFF